MDKEISTVAISFTDDSIFIDGVRQDKYPILNNRDQRIIDGVDKLNRARGRRRKCTDPNDPKFGRYI